MENLIVTEDSIKSKIYSMRGLQVMLDSDLAVLYGVKAKALNQAVKRNIERFPEDFVFQITEEEKNNLVTVCDHLKNLKFSYQLPYAFTEQGVATLSGVLRSKIAIDVNIQIMRAFVSMRKFILSNAQIFQRLDNVEIKQIEYDKNFNKLFEAIESKEITPEKGIFYGGQVFDAYKFVSEIIRSANKSITLIDNYVDESVLILFNKKDKGVKVTIFTSNLTKELKLDLEKYNSQYSPISIKEFKHSHDRFMIIDDSIVYHIGASLKDLGKKWFAFCKLDSEVVGIIEKLKEKL